MKIHVYKTRVRYAETDQMGVVYYGNYLAYLESARTGLLREEGFAYSDLEKQGILLPVTECKIQYKGAARYDEEVSVAATLAYVKNASIKFNYKVYNAEEKQIAEAYTIHPFVNREWKIITIPDDVKAALTLYLDRDEA
jgi:acyl-CoA thioester hydrolase